MKKLLLFILTLSFAFLPIINHRIDATVFAAGQRVDKDKYTFLICGVDDAAENTDALILFNYSLASNEATFVQIPRDTYFRSCVGTDKINAIYPFLRSQGKSERESMQTVCDNLSFALGIDLDGYICYTVAALARLIDAIGGIDLELPYDFSFSDGDGLNELELKRGKNHLDGSDAVKFIRYRKGYALGDLGRVDAQKFFLSAFVKKLKSSINIKVVSKAAFSSNDGITTNLKILDFLDLALKMRGRIAEASVKYSNLPGEAKKVENGRWYYFVNKKASAALLNEAKMTIDHFDKNESFLNSSNEDLISIYYNENKSFKFYDDDSLNNVIIK